MAKSGQNCGRCADPTPAVTTETFTFGASTYQVDLCDRHADAFRRDMHGWARCGTPVDERTPTTRWRQERRDDDAAFGGIVVASYVHVPTARTAPQAPQAAPQATPKPTPKPTPAPPPTAAQEPVLPEGYREWKVTEHAFDRHEERDVRPEEIYWTACHPTSRWQSDKQPTLWVYRRGDVQLVVDPTRKRIVTVCKKIDYNKELIHNGV